jgi:glycosyltransferase involved in cell wall biosynthesis
MNLKGIGVVIPAYNAGKTISKLIKELLAYGFERENIIVVDDGSRDETKTIVTALGVSVVSYNKNTGKGVALRRGFDFARHENLGAVFTLDADGQHKVSELNGFLKFKDDYDIIVGLRRFKLARMPFLRKMTNRTTSLVVSLISKKYIPDTQCGFRYINLDIFNNVDLKTKNFQTESELIVKTVRNRYKVGFVPITTVYSCEKSHIHPLVDTIRFITMAVRFLWW